MRSSTLAALAVALLTVGHATAGPVSADYHGRHLLYRETAYLVFSSDNTVDDPCWDNTVDYTRSTPDTPADYEGNFAPANDRIVNHNTVSRVAGECTPGNAPPGF